MIGLSIEAATEHAEVAVISPDGVLAHRIEAIGHGHTRRLTPLVREALEVAKVAPAALGWVAADLGPGSFTGVRVGLATARGFAFAAGAKLLGASSLASLAHAAPARKALIVPLVGAGRRDLYAGFFRADTRGRVSLVAAARVLPSEAVAAAVAEVHALVPELVVRFVGPGAGRERERLEHAYPTSTALAFRHDGLSALDLAQAARMDRGPAAGLPEPGREGEPVYVRSAQAEERVRHAALAELPITLRDTTPDDVPALVELERRVFGDPWSDAFFRSLLVQPEVWARVAERDGQIAGYGFGVLRPPLADLENIAVVPAHRRGGVARALLADLLARCRAEGVRELILEVRVSNDAAQALYRAEGFELAGLRRGYYTHPVEDALLMRKRLDAVAG